MNQEEGKLHRQTHKEPNKHNIQIQSQDVRSKELYSVLSDRSEIRQASRHHCGRWACKISKRYDK